MLKTAPAPGHPQSIPSAARLGPVHLAVTDGERALPVWRDMVGLTVLGRDGGAIRLGVPGQDGGAAETLIVLHPGAERRVVEGRTGLYHVAIHVPTRRDLARAIARMFSARFPNSPTDHLVTETTYLWDEDGNGIEMTFETPERGILTGDGEVFFGVDKDGRRHSGREAVDLQSLFGELTAGENLVQPLPAGTRIGHVHVHVGNLDAAMGFYNGVVGFRYQMLARRYRMGDVTLDYPPHILAFNTWAGEGAPQPPPGSAGLRWFTLRVPDAASLAALRQRLAEAGAPVSDVDGAIETADPSGNRLRCVVG